MSERIVITGVGVVSPIGIGKTAFWNSLDKGEAGFRSVTLFDTGKTRAKMAAEISDFKPEDILGPEGLKNLDRTTKLSLCVSKFALEDSMLVIDESNAADIGVVIGSTNGTVFSVSEFDKKALREGPYSVNPALFPNLVMCSAPSRISIKFGLKGLSSTVATGFNSGLSAIRYAVKMLERGHAKHILVGTVEELCEQTYKAFHQLNLLSGSKDGENELSAPLDQRRNGFVMGEGAVALMMETYETAKKRNAKIYAEISGVIEETSFATISKLKPYLKDVEDFASVLNSRLDIKGTDFISIGANSSKIRDVVEARLVNRLSSALGEVPAVSGIKSLVGESFSAAIGFQVLASLYCMDTNRVFPTVGVDNIDKLCRIDNLIRKPIQKRIKKSLICSADVGLPAGFLTLERSEER